MNKFTKTIGTATIGYFVHGKKPRLMIHSGTHGDEYEVVDLVKNCIDKYLHQLPDLLFIPETSPSALTRRTRKNGDGVDLNRNFTNNSAIDEAKTIMEIVRGNKFDLCFSFHEDPPQTKFYIYDVAGSLINHPGLEKLNHLRDDIKSKGITVLNGIDDPEDPALGNEFTDGYHAFSISPGSFSTWATDEKICAGVLIPEIPGLLPLDQKQFIVDAVFRHLILNSF